MRFANEHREWVAGVLESRADAYDDWTEPDSVSDYVYSLAKLVRNGAPLAKVAYEAVAFHVIEHARARVMENEGVLLNE